MKRKILKAVRQWDILDVGGIKIRLAKDISSETIYIKGQ